VAPVVGGEALRLGLSIRVGRTVGVSGRLVIEIAALAQWLPLPALLQLHIFHLRFRLEQRNTEIQVSAGPTL
jgi:hypothetical protein